MNKSNRLTYLDMAKGLGILFVLIGHLQGDTIFSLSPYIHPLCVFIFSFHMPLFFIISGILLNIKDSQNDKAYDDFSIKEFIKKRFKSIMVPYYWFSFFYFLVVIYALIKGTIAYQTFFVNLWYVLSCYGMNVLWFLPALFFGEIIFVLLKHSLKDKSFTITVIIISIIGYALAYLMTTFNYDTELLKRFHELCITLLRPFLVCSWIFIGYRLHPVLSKLSDFKPKYLCVLCGIALLIICAILSRVNNGVDFRSLVLRNIFFYILCSLLGSYGLILLCKGLPRIGLLCFWGSGSLIFMAVHNSETILFYALKFSMYINQYLTHARGYICYGIILGIILLYTSLMIIIIQKGFPFIIGKPFKSSIFFKNK